MKFGGKEAQLGFLLHSVQIQSGSFSLLPELVIPQFCEGSWCISKM